ncbi:MAG: hypothetical protein U0936_27855, partial [Planctomycetaceae bacterium]
SETEMISAGLGQYSLPWVPWPSRIGDPSEDLSLSERSGIATDDSGHSTSMTLKRHARGMSSRPQRVWITTTRFANAPAPGYPTRGISSRKLDDRFIEIMQSNHEKLAGSVEMEGTKHETNESSHFVCEFVHFVIPSADSITWIFPYART